MTYDIDMIFDLLSWDQTRKNQDMGMRLASEIKNISVFIMPIESKKTWENCAKVLASKEDEELKKYLFNLFEWLQDMNWPGAYIIYDRLLRVSHETILPVLEYSLKNAKRMNDFSWKRSLNEFYNDLKNTGENTADGSNSLKK